MRNSFIALLLVGTIFAVSFANAQEQNSGRWRRGGNRDNSQNDGQQRGGFPGGGFPGGPGGGFPGGPGGGFPGGPGGGFPGGPGGFPGGGQGGFPGGGFSGGGSREDRMAGFLQQFDTNKNGQIDANEVQSLGPRAGMIEGMIRNAGMEPKFPVKISAIQDGMKAARNNWNRNGSPLGLPGSASGGQTPAGENGEAKSEAKTTPLVPGFGVEQKKAEVPGFGATVKTSTTASEGAASGDQPAGTPETPANVPNQIDERTRKFAESYLKQRDKNKSGVLERDKGEWDEVPDAKSIDRNHDNVIAQDEMIIYFLEKNGRPAPRPKGPENPAAAKAVTPSNSSKNGSVYRLLSPQERLPDGLPDWFLRCDTDADGQIAMSEYARDWTAEKAKEFARYDLNGDGTITPQEFLQTK